MATAARGQTALPDTRLTPRNAYQEAFQQPSYQGGPVLTASDERVLGLWLSLYEADHVSLGWAVSTDRGQEWSAGDALQIGVNNGYGSVEGPHASAVDSSRSALLFTWGGAYFIYRSTSSELPSFGAPGRTSASTLPDIPSIASDPSSGYAYSCFTSKNPSEFLYPFIQYSIQFMRSADGGQSWEPPVTLSSVYCEGSSLALGPDGELYVAWMDYQQGKLVGRKSTDHGTTFSPEFTIAPPLDNLGAAMKGWAAPVFSPQRLTPWYVVGSSLYAPNYPRIAVDLSTGPTRGHVYAVWAEHAAGGPAPAQSQVSETEDNSSFATANLMPLNTDWTGFVDGDEFGTFDLDIFAFDGRAGQTIQFWGELLDDGYSQFTWPTVPWTMYGTRPDGTIDGIYRGPMIRLSNSPPVRPAIITLPNTGRYYIAVQSGTQPVLYQMHLREFQPSPGSAAQDMRDIVLASSSDGGQTWSAPRRVNHGPGDSDQNMPNLAVDGQGRVCVAWYDRRGFALSDSVNAYAAVSLDGGLTFGPDMKLSSAPSYWSGAPGAGGFGNYVGDRIAIAAGDNYAVVAWTDFRNGSGAITPGDPDVYAARIVNDVATAVEDVSDLTAAPTTGGVRVRWVVNDLRRVAGLRVFRSEPDSAERALGDDDVRPTRAGESEFLDGTAQPGRTYSYRLRILRGASADWLGPVQTSLPAAVTALAWRRASPNPFAAGTEVVLAVPAAATGTVRIFDVQGKEVRTVRAGRFEPGETSLAWDGRDAHGSDVAPGIYFVSAEIGGRAARMKLARVQ